MDNEAGRCLADGELSDMMLRRRRREDHSDPRTVAFMSGLGIPADGMCLEVGAGLGSVARWMASSLAPKGLVLATEIRSDLVDSIAERAPANLEVIRHDIVTDPLPRRTFDLIHARFVLEHLRTRDGVLSLLASLLSPGGWLVIEDAHIAMNVLDGPGPYLDAMVTFTRHRASLGSDYNWARNLPANFQRLGLGSIRAQRVADIFESGSDLSAFWAAVLQQEAISAGVAPDGASAAVLLLRAGSEWFSSPSVIQCAGRRQ